MATATLRNLVNTMASYKHHYGEADPRYVQAAQELTVRRLADAIAVALAASPPMTDAQRTALARMLIGADDMAAARH